MRTVVMVKNPGFETTTRQFFVFLQEEFGTN